MSLIAFTNLQKIKKHVDIINFSSSISLVRNINKEKGDNNRMVNYAKENANVIAKKYLKSHGIKQRFIAKSMGISEPTLTGRLNGRLKFDSDFSIAFAKALNISPNIFLKYKFSDK